MSYKKIVIVGIIWISGFAPVAAQTHRGKASYYSKRATGARTASGERLHHDSLTCAHKTYPFGTILKVTNLSNDRVVYVKVTDRGPFARGRIIDLSYGAARELGMLAQGVGMVEVERVDQPVPPYRWDNRELGLPSIKFKMGDMMMADIERTPDEQDEAEETSNKNTSTKAKTTQKGSASANSVTTNTEKERIARKLEARRQFAAAKRAARQAAAKKGSR